MTANEITKVREIQISYRQPKHIGEAVTAPAVAARFVRSIVKGDAREHFIALYLDARHRPAAYRTVSIGTATASLVHPREVFQAAVHVGAVALIVAHNHPSGDSNPSLEDVRVTERLVESGKILGITLLDHIVVTDRGFHSLQAERPHLFA